MGTILVQPDSIEAGASGIASVSWIVIVSVVSFAVDSIFSSFI
jgi:hypothetical protein